MTSKLAYQVSYTTEYRDGRVETHEMHTRYFPTREYAVSHARNLTDDARENNGVFVGQWVTPFASMIDPEYAEEIRVTATVETVTISEIAHAIDAE